MKTVITGIFVVLSYICAIVFKIWALISFILYLVKDRPFDWFSLWLCIGGWGGVIVFGLLSIIFKHVEAKTILKSRTSSFQKKLEKMAEERKQKTHN
jgi:hypothetical protein